MFEKCSLKVLNIVVAATCGSDAQYRGAGAALQPSPRPENATDLEVVGDADLYRFRGQVGPVSEFVAGRRRRIGDQGGLVSFLSTEIEMQVLDFDAEVRSDEVLHATAR